MYIMTPYTWNYLTVCKQMSSSDSFKNELPTNYSFKNHMIYIYVCVCVCVCVCERDLALNNH